MLAMDTEFIQSFANTFLACPCWTSASELPCMWPVSDVCSCLWPHPFRWYRKNRSEQAVLSNGPQCTEWLQPHLQPSLQDPPLAATADINNPSPSSCPQAWEGLPEAGTH